MEKMPEQTKTEKLRQNNHLIKHGLPCLLSNKPTFGIKLDVT